MLSAVHDLACSYAPTFAVDIHLPEYWANLQFSNQPVNSTAMLVDPEVRLLMLTIQFMLIINNMLTYQSSQRWAVL